MGKKYLPLFVVLAAVVLVGVLAVALRSSSPTVQQEQQQASVFPESGASEEPIPAPHVVSYDGSAYSPARVDVSRGESVVFINQGRGEMWPASAVHPTHTAYPTTGGCIGSTFDACRGHAVGESWSFTFDQGGSWNYHDHLNASARGTVVVK